MMTTIPLPAGIYIGNDIHIKCFKEGGHELHTA